MRPQHLLVLDMDNTLFDWRAHFCTVFEPLVPALSDLIGESSPVLKSQFRKIHQDEGHMEWASAIRGLPSVSSWARSNTARISEIDVLVHRFVEFGRSKLKTYPAVDETLKRIGGAGWTIVVFTESPAVEAAERLHGMNILDKVDVVYGSRRPSDGVPPPDAFRVHLSPFAKPAPEVLRRIMNRHGATAGTTIYVGDSMTRDMPMAREAGVIGVWARYGSIVEPKHREVISEVSCWAAKKVRQELEARSVNEYQADFVIDCFPEVEEVLAARNPSRRIAAR